MLSIDCDYDSYCNKLVNYKIQRKYHPSICLYKSIKLEGTYSLHFSPIHISDTGNYDEDGCDIDFMAEVNPAFLKKVQQASAALLVDGSDSN